MESQGKSAVLVSETSFEAGLSPSNDRAECTSMTTGSEFVLNSLHAPGVANKSLVKAIAMGQDLYQSLTAESRASLHLRGRKRQSLRKLAQARQIPISTLWRSLAIYLLRLRHPEVLQFTHIGVCHVSVVLAVPTDRQIDYLRRAEQGRWSRARLERVVKADAASRAAEATAMATASATLPAPVRLAAGAEHMH